MDSDYQDLTASYSQKPSNYFEAERAEILKFIPTRVSRLLDVGCGSGAFGALVKRERPGVEVWGIEPTFEAAEAANHKLDHVIMGIFPSDKCDLDLNEQEFDCIVFNDVLEHMLEPEAALVGARRLLKKDACVIASIPNILFWPVLYRLVFRQDWEYSDSGVLDRTHFRFFTRKSMLRMFEECNYVVENVNGVNAAGGDLKCRLVNFFLSIFRSDWKYQQFVITATKIKS